MLLGGAGSVKSSPCGSNSPGILLKSISKAMSNRPAASGLELYSQITSSILHFRFIESMSTSRIAISFSLQRTNNLSLPISSAVFLRTSESLLSVAMPINNNLLERAKKYHENLPDKIYEYLNGRGIPDVLIDYHLL